MSGNTHESSSPQPPVSDQAIRQWVNGRAGAHRPDLDTRSRPPVPPDGADLAVRSVQPEILDRLPQFSSAARSSRRDLRIINGLLRSHAWFAAWLHQLHREGEMVLEIGAGTGELGRTLHRIAPRLAGLDLGPRPTDWPREASWFETDVLAFSGWKNFPVVVASLFFHHFGPADLAKLGAQLNAHARVIIASEPLRHRRALALFSLICPLIRAHPVTRHDGRVSIGAGFCHEELPRLLQLDPARWNWRVQATWLGTSRLVAVRRP